MAANTPEWLCPDIPLVDGHVHISAPGLYDGIRAGMEGGGGVRMNLASLLQDEQSNATALHYKERDPDRFYIFGALDYGEYDASKANDPAHVAAAARRLAAQPARLKALGFDGIKMIEGKPTTRRLLRAPMDGPLYAGYFAAAEESGLPILWHVGDTRLYWDPEKVPAKARERGWGYDRPDDPSLEQLRGEAEAVIARHPRLAVIFAHFFFLGPELPRARRMLQDHPNVHLDTTPGIEMYASFNRDREAARAFFTEFQDRIVFGTDLNSGKGPDGVPRFGAEGAARTYRRMRAYFGSENEMPEHFPGSTISPPGTVFRGLNLPKEVLAKVFHANFERLAGQTPAPSKPAA